jgi:hypothetical protein
LSKLIEERTKLLQEQALISKNTTPDQLQEAQRFG